MKKKVMRICRRKKKIIEIEMQVSPELEKLVGKGSAGKWRVATTSKGVPDRQTLL